IFVHEEDFDNSKNFGPYIGNCTGGAECVQFVSCSAHVRVTTKDYCTTFGGRRGVCCRTGQNHSEPIVSFRHRTHHHMKLDFATMGILTRKSRNKMAELRSRESKLFAKKSSILYPGSASYSHFRNSRRFNPTDLAEVENMANRAMEIAIATKAFKERQGISSLQLEIGIAQQDLRSTALGDDCLPVIICPVIPPRFRTIDGSCNNQMFPNWGTPLTPFSRLLPLAMKTPTSYGIWFPRVSVVDGRQLSSPRLISATLFSEDDAHNQEYTLMVMQFGQLVSHEITQSLDTTFINGSAISCCTDGGQNMLPIEERHYACMPIDIPENDPFFGRFKQRCMNFVRSILSPRLDCTLGYAQQMNKVTHFIDGSSIYGSTPEQTGELRSFSGGRLRIFKDFGRELLPLTKDKDACLTMEQGTACFDSGDTRTNQMVTLAVLHTVFLREHNRIADFLAKLNPHWHDERIFLEARQIVVAEMQVIIYKEFFAGCNRYRRELAMEEFDLKLKGGHDYSFDYNENVEPSVINEFSAAAFRFGHSMVDGVLRIYGMKKFEEMISIPEIMFYPSRMRRYPFLDQVLNSLTTEPIQEVDERFSPALTNYLFRGGNPFGVDLASINIQRGRDHGLRPYNDYRNLVGLPTFTSFADFGKVQSVLQTHGEKLSRLYATVDDVDLWIGGLLEEKAPGSIVGLTFRDIIAEQFSRLKKGDRYFFDNDPSINPGHFTPDQLLEVRKSSMSRLICDNADGVLLARQAANAFRRPGVPGF
ncbi:hypothetical protein NQ317_019401, partial [Molorchus minor]